MKHIFLPIVLLLSMLVSCTDDKEEVITIPVQEGDEILFGAGLPSDVKSRTIYGDYTLDDKLGHFPVNWINTDEIAIFCPQASNPSQNWARFSNRGLKLPWRKRMRGKRISERGRRSFHAHRNRSGR